MGRLSAQNQMYIAIALIAIVTIAVVVFAILPLFQEAGSIDDQIGSEQSNLAAAQALLARRQSAKAQAAANEVELMRIANAIPDSPQLPSVIIELQDVANAAGVEFDSLAPTDLTPGKPPVEGGTPEYSSVPITITMHGKWVEIIDYVNRIHALDRSTRITASTYSYIPASDTEEAYVDANVTLEVYVMAAASSGAAAPTTTTP